MLKIYFNSFKFWDYNAHCHSWKEEKHLSDSYSLQGKKEIYQNVLSLTIEHITLASKRPAELRAW